MLSDSDIRTQFGNVLGRDPTASELADFKRYGNTGYANLGASDIAQILQGTPEYQQTQLQNFGGQYANALGQGDARTLGLAQNQLSGQFAQMGRDIGGSGYVNAFAQAAQNLAMQRQQSLANFYGSGFQNIMQNTQGQAQGALGYGREQITGGVQRANQLTDINRQRQWDLEDYQRQKQDYENYLKQQSGFNLGNTLLSGAIGLGGIGLRGFMGGFSGGGGGSMSPMGFAQPSGGMGLGYGNFMGGMRGPGYASNGLFGR